MIAALQNFFPRIGYIKPVGQRFVEIEEQKIDEDTVLMDAVYQMNCPLVDMSPIAVEPDFTRKYLQAANNDALVRKIQNAFDRVAWEKDFVLCEGSGHAGVGSVFDLSNARVAKLLGAKVIIVSQGGIGKPIDEISLNQALFEKENVEIIGVILNKVLGEKVDYVSDFARRGLKRKGLDLLGVLPHEQILCNPSVELVREELHAEFLNHPSNLHALADDIVVGAMSAQNAIQFFKRGTLLITPGDREDLVLAAGATDQSQQRRQNGGHRPHRRVAAQPRRAQGDPGHAGARVARPGGQLPGRLQSQQPDRQNPARRRGKNFVDPRHRCQIRECQKNRRFPLMLPLSPFLKTLPVYQAGPPD